VLCVYDWAEKVQSTRASGRPSEPVLPAGAVRPWGGEALWCSSRVFRLEFGLQHGITGHNCCSCLPLIPASSAMRDRSKTPIHIRACNKHAYKKKGLEDLRRAEDKTHEKC
jgi:hypothetical protein